MKKKIFYLFIVLVIVGACSKDDMAITNTDPTAVSKADLRFLFTQMQVSNDVYGYGQWFYDYDRYVFPWMQLTSGQRRSGNSDDFNNMVEKDGHWNTFYNTMIRAARIWNEVDNSYVGAGQAALQKLKYATYPLVIFQGMMASDFFGPMPYTEACKAHYTNPPLLTPVYDTQKTLFETWDKELIKAFEVLNNPVMLDGNEIAQTRLDVQDMTYGGDWSKWAKFTNTVRLKLASRWYDADPQRAIKIVNEVVASGVYMKEESDDYCFYNGIYDFGPGGAWNGYGSKNFIDFLRENKDPRLLYYFEKNRISSSVIQAFLNEGKALPKVVKPYIKLSADGTTFEGWEKDGEPWGRYHGVPVQIVSEQSEETKQSYFRDAPYMLKGFASTVVFYPYSLRNTYLICSNENYTYPDIEVKGKLYPEFMPQSRFPRKQRNVTCAETYYLLTEFKLLGANIPDGANVLFHKAITLSVQGMDAWANTMHIPYYDLNDQNDPYTVSVKLQQKWIDELLTRPAYNLTGDRILDLEKLYVNMIVHYFPTGTNAYSIARKGGVPKTNSTIGFAREAFNEKKDISIPRRFNITEPLKSNINFDNMMKGYQEAGFSTNVGSQPEVLAKERIWYDQNAPEWGAGPK